MRQWRCVTLTPSPSGKEDTSHGSESCRGGIFLRRRPRASLSGRRGAVALFRDARTLLRTLADQGCAFPSPDNWEGTPPEGVGVSGEKGGRTAGLRDLFKPHVMALQLGSSDNTVRGSSGCTVAGKPRSKPDATSQRESVTCRGLHRLALKSQRAPL